MTPSPTPPSWLTVPVKNSSTRSCDRPIASKTWAPRYDATVEMPIFDITLSTPLPSALMRLATAFSSVTSVMAPLRTMSSTVSIAR